MDRVVGDCGRWVVTAAVESEALALECAVAFVVAEAH